MTLSYTPSLSLPNPSTGSATGTWGDIENTGRTLTDAAIAGWLSLDCSAGGTITLTSTSGAANQARNAMLKLTGTLPSNTSIVIPNVSKLYVIEDGTTRAGFTLGVKTSGGSALSLTNGVSRWVKCDGSGNVTYAESGLTIPVPVASGGTGSTSAAGARTNLGLGTIATQDASAVTITGGSITGITDLAVADGGTGASTASGARTNLGLGTIATQDASAVAITGGSITGITDLAIADGGTGASTAANARTNLGLGTIATQNANNVAITGGSISGVSGLLSGATQAQMEAASSTSVAVTPGVAQYHPGTCKAWGKVTNGGSASLSAGYNITNVSRTATGTVTVTIGTDFSSANYAVMGSCNRDSGGRVMTFMPTSQSSGSFVVETVDNGNSNRDADFWFACFGDQP